MIRTTLVLAGIAVLASSTVFMTAGSALAAPPGGPLRFAGGARFGGLGRVGGFGRFGGFNRFGGVNGFLNRFPLHYNGGYGIGSPYSGYYPGYGSYYYGSSYPGSYYEYTWVANSPAKPELTTEEKDARALLAASGVPTEDGRPVWPLALRVLPESESLRAQIDGLVQEAASQASRGRPTKAVVKELVDATSRLRKLLVRHKEERGGLAQTSYEEAERFLDKLEKSRTLLES